MRPQLEERDARVFAQTLDLLDEAGIPFMIGGAFAMNHYVGLWRDTKDLDVFCERDMGIRALAVLGRQGFTTRARPGELLGRPVRFCAPEDIILSKAYVAGRERFDGADIAHLMRACGRDIDWDELAERFGDHWPLFLHYLVLFRFVYPEERELVPARLVHELAARIGTGDEVADALSFRGPLVDRYGYLHDLDEEGLPDPREDMARRAGLPIQGVTYRRDRDREALQSGKVYLPADTSTPPE